MKNKLKFEPLAIRLLNDIEIHGGKVYIVGGIVRDMFIKDTIDYHDVDVEVYQLSIEILQQILMNYGHVDLIGKSFGVLKVSCLPNFDFALPRIEKKVGETHQDFEIVINQKLDLRKASSRRDLTMNALMYEYATGKVYDFYGGEQDILHRRIRMVNPKTFREDPLRVLRVAQFASRYEFTIDQITKDFCQDMVTKGMLISLSSERVYQEYCKILMSPKPSIGLTFLSDIGALPTFLEDLKKTHQRKDFHPEGNVWIHTMLVIDMAALVKQRSSQPLWFMWSCLLHDIGKPLVTTKTGSAPLHNESGIKVFNQECKTLITNSKMQKYIEKMILYHMHLMNMTRNNAKDISYYRVLKGIDGVLPIEDLLLISKCDKLGRKRIAYQEIEKLELYMQDKMERLGKVAVPPYIDGNVLLDLGFPQSKKFKEILTKAYEWQLMGKSKEEIIESIKSMVGDNYGT